MRLGRRKRRQFQVALYRMEQRLLSGSVNHDDEAQVKRSLFNSWAVDEAFRRQFPHIRRTEACWVFGVDGDREPQHVKLVVHHEGGPIHFHNVAAGLTVRMQNDQNVPGRRTFRVERSDIGTLKDRFGRCLDIMAALTGARGTT